MIHNIDSLSDKYLNIQYCLIDLKTSLGSYGHVKIIFACYIQSYVRFDSMEKNLTWICHVLCPRGSLTLEFVHASRKFDICFHNEGITCTSYFFFLIII